MTALRLLEELRMSAKTPPPSDHTVPTPHPANCLKKVSGNGMPPTSTTPERIACSSRGQVSSNPGYVAAAIAARIEASMTVAATLGRTLGRTLSTVTTGTTGSSIGKLRGGSRVLARISGSVVRMTE